METADDTVAEMQMPTIPALETFFTALWCEMFEREDIGRHENFFELGGQSLHVMIVINVLREHFGIEISPLGLFEAPTVAGLAVLCIDGEKAGEAEEEFTL